MAYNKKESYEDAIMKMAWDTFAKKGLKMFGIHKKVKDDGRTELVSLDLTYLHMDHTYLMEDDTYAHFEFQSSNDNTADLQRFAAYDALLTHKTGKEVFTYVVYSAGIKKPTSELNSGFSTYRIKPVTLANINGDEKCEEI